MRNKFSYHFPRPAEIEQGFEAVPNDDELPWEWYLSETNTNTFYFSCEMVVGFGAISQVQGEPGLNGCISEVAAGGHTHSEHHAVFPHAPYESNPAEAFWHVNP